MIVCQICSLIIYTHLSSEPTANCTQITVQYIRTKNLLLEHSSVVKNLTACIGVQSASVNCVLKPALQASNHNLLISCRIC